MVNVPTVEMAWQIFKAKTVHMIDQMLSVYEPLQDPLATLGSFGVESMKEHGTLNSWIKKLKEIRDILEKDDG